MFFGKFYDRDGYSNMEDGVLMLGKVRRSIAFICLSLLLFMSWSPLVFGREIVNVCNHGDVEVFYASLGVHDTWLSTNAKAQGLFTIDPGQCRDVVPGEMSNVTVAFFYKDQSEKFGNVVFDVEGDEASLFHTKIPQICVDPDGFRDTLTQNEVSLSQFIKKWTPPCLKGYFPAKTSFGVWGEKDFIFSVDISPSQATPVPAFPLLP